MDDEDTVKKDFIGLEPLQEQLEHPNQGLRRRRGRQIDIYVKPLYSEIKYCMLMDIKLYCEFKM